MADPGSGNPGVKLLFGKPVATEPPSTSSTASTSSTLEPLSTIHHQPLARKTSGNEEAGGDGNEPKKTVGARLGASRLFLNKILGGKQIGGGGANAGTGRRLVPPKSLPATGPQSEVDGELESGEVTPTESPSSDAMSPPANLTLLCRNIPEALNNRNDLRQHFERFGPVRKVNPLPNQSAASVIFVNHNDAVVAKETGTRMRDGSDITIYWKAQRKQSVSIGAAAAAVAAPTQAKAPLFRAQPAQPARPAAQPVAKAMKPIMKAPTRASSAALSWVPSHIRVPPSVATIFTLAGSGAQERADIMERCDKVIYDLMAEIGSKREHAIVGTCDDMCPERERYDREFQRRLSRFELIEGTDGYIIDHRRALKEYARSAADQREPLPYELRTPTALDNTMTYLLQKICPLSDEFDESALPEWADWYHFLWTRTRAIRKDITQQHLVSVTGISLMERCARFHAFCAERLAEVPNTAGFDQKLNSQNLTKCLQSLKEMYADMRHSKNVAPDEDLPELENESEFTGYRILMKLDEGAILNEIERVSATVRYSRPVQFALAVFSAYNTNNYSRFFRMFREQATYFEVCLMHRYLTLIRSRALKTALHAYTPNERSAVQVPISDVCSMLCFESTEECEAFLSAHGIQMAGPGLIDFVRMNYYQPETWPSSKRLPSIMKMKQMDTTIAELINGGPMPPSRELHEPATSFDSTGHFIGSPHFRSQLLKLLEALQNNNNQQHQEMASSHQHQQHQSQAISTTRPSAQFQFGHQSSAGSTFSSQPWPTAQQQQQQQKVQQESEQVEKTMALHALSTQIFTELVNDVIKSDCREIAFSVNLMFKRHLANSEPMADQLLTSFIGDFVSTIAGNLLSDAKADVSLRNALTTETTSSVVNSVVDELTRDVARDVRSLLFDAAGAELSSLFAEIAREETKTQATYWARLSRNDRQVRAMSSRRLQRHMFNSWILQTKQLLSLREHSNRPFPTGPRLSIKEASEAVCCSSKVLADGSVVRVPFALSPPAPLFRPERSLSLQVKTATMAASLQIPPEKLEIPSLSTLMCLPGPSNYPVWVLWKLVVVVPSRYRDNLYLLRHVESIFKTFPSRNVDSASVSPRLVASVVLVSVDSKHGAIKVEGSNLLQFHVNTEHDAATGASAVLIFDDALSSQPSIDAVGRLLSAATPLTGSNPVPFAVLRLSGQGSPVSKNRIESFITAKRSFDKKCSNSLVECVDFLLNISLTPPSQTTSSTLTGSKVVSAVSAVKLLSDFIYSKVTSPIKADLHNRKVSAGNPGEMPASITLSLYNCALAYLKTSSEGIVVAPEILAALTSSSGKSVDSDVKFIPLSREEHSRLLGQELILPNVQPNEAVGDYVSRSFLKFPLEIAMLNQKCVADLVASPSVTGGGSNDAAFRWTNAILDCISSRLSLTFSNCFGANSVMFFNQVPRGLLDAFQPPVDWLYEAERVQVSAFSRRPQLPSVPTAAQVKRGISATWQEIEQLEGAFFAKRQRNQNTKSDSNLSGLVLLRSTSVSASSLLSVDRQLQQRTPLSELDRHRSTRLLNSTTFFME